MTMTISQINEMMPSGFSPAWTQDFRESADDIHRRTRSYDDAPHEYLVEGYDDIDTVIPATALDARAAARRYWDDVQQAIIEAREHEAQAITHLDAGELEEALTELEAAASCERQYGDYPTYRPVIDALAALIDDAEELAEELAEAWSQEDGNQIGDPVIGPDVEEYADQTADGVWRHRWASGYTADGRTIGHYYGPGMGHAVATVADPVIARIDIGRHGIHFGVQIIGLTYHV